MCTQCVNWSLSADLPCQLTIPCLVAPPASCCCAVQLLAVAAMGPQTEHLAAGQEYFVTDGVAVSSHWGLGSSSHAMSLLMAVAGSLLAAVCVWAWLLWCHRNGPRLAFAHAAQLARVLLCCLSARASWISRLCTCCLPPLTTPSACAAPGQHLCVPPSSY